MFSKPQDLARMYEPFSGVNLIGLSNFIEIGRKRGAVDRQRRNAECAPRREGSLTRPRPLAGGVPAGNASTPGAGR